MERMSQMWKKLEGEFFILEDGKPQRAESFSAFLEWCCRVKEDPDLVLVARSLIVETDMPTCSVLTFFSPSQHAFPVFSFDGNAGCFFETIVIGGPEEWQTLRHLSVEQAWEGHEEILRRISSYRSQVATSFGKAFPRQDRPTEDKKAGEFLCSDGSHLFFSKIDVLVADKQRTESGVRVCVFPFAGTSTYDVWCRNYDEVKELLGAFNTWCSRRSKEGQPAEKKPVGAWETKDGRVLFFSEVRKILYQEKSGVFSAVFTMKDGDEVLVFLDDDGEKEFLKRCWKEFMADFIKKTGENKDGNDH